MKPRIKHAIWERGCFPGLSLGTELSFHYNEAIFSENFYGWQKDDREFGQREILVSGIDIQTCLEHITEGIKGYPENYHNPSIVPRYFCPVVVHKRPTVFGRGHYSKVDVRSKQQKFQCGICTKTYH